MALYFCTGVLKEEQFFKHYALNVPLYTHFTSPIRRYADIIVHRLLASSLSMYLHYKKSFSLCLTQKQMHTFKQITDGLFCFEHCFSCIVGYICLMRKGLQAKKTKHPPDLTLLCCLSFANVSALPASVSFYCILFYM